MTQQRHNTVVIIKSYNSFKIKPNGLIDRVMKPLKSPLNLQSCSEESEVINIIRHIQKYITRRISNADNVDDLVQEALIRTLNRNKSTKIDNFPAYLNQVAKSVIYHDWQKNKNQHNNDDEMELVAPKSNDPESKIITEQKLKLVKQALDELPPLRRKVFELRRLEGLSREEICLKLDMSQESVKKHITRAMTQITLHIEKHQ